jgi:hypothetical protein
VHVRKQHERSMRHRVLRCTLGQHCPLPFLMLAVSSLAICTSNNPWTRTRAAPCQIGSGGTPPARGTCGRGRPRRRGSPNAGALGRELGRSASMKPAVAPASSACSGAGDMQTPQKRPLSISQQRAHAQHAIGIERITPLARLPTSRDACQASPYDAVCRVASSYTPATAPAGV